MYVAKQVFLMHFWLTFGRAKSDYICIIKLFLVCMGSRLELIYELILILS